MSGLGTVIWPEGEPDKARFAAHWLAKQWLVLGPLAFSAAFRGRRMRSAWPVAPDEHPIVLARNIERRFRP